MKIPITKLSGAGNDFIIIDNRDGKVTPTTEFISKVCARRLSVGADGLLLVEQPHDPTAADFRMRYFNADGGEVESCGNGARCIARFAFLNGIVGERTRFETLAGIYDAEILGDRVRVRMGDPRDVRLRFPLTLSEGTFTVDYANTGVPHVVFFVDDLDATDVVAMGRQTRYHRDFAPAGTNANFVSVTDSRTLRIRTYERGVEDETLACGTGSIAAALVAALQGTVSSPVTLHTQGGFVLGVHFDIENGAATNVRLEGDARVIYHAELQPDAWQY
jgi:diaminopimelate epimerase